MENRWSMHDTAYSWRWNIIKLNSIVTIHFMTFGFFSFRKFKSWSPGGTLNILWANNNYLSKEKKILETWIYIKYKILSSGMNNRNTWEKEKGSTKNKILQKYRNISCFHIKKINKKGKKAVFIIYYEKNIKIMERSLI